MYKWMEWAEMAGWFASGCARVYDGRIHPTAIRRVAVIEIIAILCPVSSAILAIVLFLSAVRFSTFIVLDAVSSLRDRIMRRE